MQAPTSSSGATTLPKVQIVGFTGHRHLQNPGAVASAFRAELAALKSAGGEVIAISSVAIGSDMIFAREALGAGIKWVVVLPMPRELFREDFTPEDWAEAERLIAQAAEVRVLRGTERPQVYVDCGKATVDESDSLLALWDGKPAAGPGGTAEIVAYARTMEREIILLRENAGAVEKIDPSHFGAADHTTEDLLKVIGPAAPLPPPPAGLVEHFQIADAEATRVAPNFRRSTLFMAGLHLGATLVAGLAFAMEARHLLFGITTLAVLKVLFIFGAYLLFLRLKSTHAHDIWLRQRLIAEYCRSIIATWHCRDLVEPVSIHAVPELRDLARSALFLRLEKDARAVVDAKAFRAAYAHERVMVQFDYFRNEGDKAEAQALPLRRRYHTYTIAALATSSVVLGLRLADPAFTIDSFASLPMVTRAGVIALDISPLVLPALASFVLTRLAIKDIDRRIGRFRDLQNKMRTTLIDLSFCGSWESLSRSVERTEKILFNEVLEWYSISKYSPMA